MFATILRRWRLVTPLALAVLAISVVAGGVLMPASAHNEKFHFFGRAFALADDSTVLPDTACDTGFIQKVGSASIDTGHCFGVDGQGEPGAGITGSGRLESIFSDATVVSSHGKTKGKVLAKVDMEEAAGAHGKNLQGCQATFFPLTVNNTVSVTTTTTSTSSVTTTNADGTTTTSPTSVTSTASATQRNPEDSCTPVDALTFPPGTTTTVVGPTVTTTGPSGQTGTTSQTRATITVPNHPAFSLLDDSFGVANAGDTLFWADLITVAAEAECHARLNGTAHASVASAIELSDAAVREDNRLRYIGPQGSVGNAGLANTTFTISGFTFGQLIIRDIVVIVNEQHRFEDGNFAGISVNAIHLIGSDDDGLVKFNFILGHAFAGIHCARHLDGQDTLVIPGA